MVNNAVGAPVARITPNKASADMLHRVQQTNELPIQSLNVTPILDQVKSWVRCGTHKNFTR